MHILNDVGARAARAMNRGVQAARDVADDPTAGLPMRAWSLPAISDFVSRAAPARAGARRNRLVRALGWFSLGLAAVEVLAPRALSRKLGLYRGRNALPVLGAREALSGVGLLAARNPAPWLWSRVAGDAMDLALIARAARRPENDGISLGLAFAAVLGVALVDLLAARRGARPRPA